MDILQSGNERRLPCGRRVVRQRRVALLLNHSSGGKQAVALTQLYALTPQGEWEFEEPAIRLIAWRPFRRRHCVRPVDEFGVCVEMSRKLQKKKITKM